MPWHLATTSRFLGFLITIWWQISNSKLETRNCLPLNTDYLFDLSDDFNQIFLILHHRLNRFVSAGNFVQHAYVLGQSAGGSVAIGFALAHPDRVDALILHGAVPGGFVLPEQGPFAEHDSVIVLVKRYGMDSLRRAWAAHPINRTPEEKTEVRARHPGRARSSLAGPLEWVYMFAVNRFGTARFGARREPCADAFIGCYPIWKAPDVR